MLCFYGLIKPTPTQISSCALLMLSSLGGQEDKLKCRWDSQYGCLRMQNIGDLALWDGSLRLQMWVCLTG
jgi:hypothetical protein